MNQKVAIQACDAYEKQKVRAAIEKTIEGIGGLGTYMEPGRTVFIKTNLILGKKAERHATTHPIFIQALGEILQDYGMRVIVGDSPGGPFNLPALKYIYRTTGIEEIAKESGFMLNENTGSIEVENPDGVLMKKLTMTAYLQDADYVVSACKLKTHSMMTYTGAAKNMFGTIPGTVKADYHVRMPSEEDFANALLDICMAADPVLSFMDAIIGMEGNGPTAGKPRAIGAVLASPSPYALDHEACRLISLSVEQVPMLRLAKARGLLDPETITLVGDDPEALRVPDFKMPDHLESDLLRLKMPNWIADTISRISRAKVRFDPEHCVGCGVCAANCPPKALTMVKDQKTGKNRPSVDYKKCIRCFCCQELCPQEAVRVHESVIFKLVNKL